MITTEGKTYIKRYLAGWVPAIASSIAFGIGDKGEVPDDKKLQFEIGRADIAITSYDFVNNRLIYKAPLPDDFGGTIYEVGLFTEETNSISGDFGSMLLSSFDSDSEGWFNPVDGSAATFSSANTRVGDDSLRLVAPAGGAARARLDGILMDFSGNTSADKFYMAVNVGNNVASIELRLMTDSSNYFTLTYNPNAGYKTINAAISSATLTGTPDWGEINMLEVRVTATSGGSATVDFDGIRIEDLDTPNPDYVMISRELLAAPFVKEAGRIQAIEFALDVAI